MPGQPGDLTEDPTYVVWAPLPDEVEIVVFRSGRLRAWQRPVSKIVAFPWPSGYFSEFSLVAFDTDRVEVARHGDKWPI